MIEPTAEIKVKKTGAKQIEGSAGGKGRGKRSWGGDYGEKKVEKGSKQAGDEMILPKQP